MSVSLNKPQSDTVYTVKATDNTLDVIESALALLAGPTGGSPNSDTRTEAAAILAIVKGWRVYDNSKDATTVHILEPYTRRGSVCGRHDGGVRTAPFGSPQQADCTACAAVIAKLKDR